MSSAEPVVRSYLGRSYSAHLGRARFTGLLERHADMEEAEAAAILWFTSGRSNELLTRFRSEAETPADLDFVAVLETAIQKLPFCREDYVDRVIRVPAADLPAFREKYRIGQVVPWRAPTSCSTSHAFRDRGNVLFLIRQRTGRVVGSYSWYPHENEIVILGGHEYIVTSFDESHPDRIVVGLEEQPVEE